MFVITKMNMVSMPWVTCGQKKGALAIETKKLLLLFVDKSWTSPHNM